MFLKSLKFLSHIYKDKMKALDEVNASLYNEM
jgi:hypothetical protein